MAFDDKLRGYVIGRGQGINNPAMVRIDDTYAFVGVIDENGEWIRLSGWLGLENEPGTLVYIPDKPPAPIKE